MKNYFCRCSHAWVGHALCSFITITTAFGQTISGSVTDEHHEPIPFAHVFINELANGTSADDKGNYFLTINPGIYHVVVSSVGYTTITQEIIITSKPLVRDFVLHSSSVELNEVVVKSKRRDPAYEIIQKAIENKARYRKQVTSSRTNIYVRAMEVIDRKKKKQVDTSPEDETEKGPPKDPFEEKRKAEQAKMNSINLVEMNLTLNYQYPEKFKEERTAFKAYGSREGLFIPVFSETDFSFYENLVELKGISEVPVISPLSRTSILSYKFKLEEITKEDQHTVYKIKVTPRKTGDATARGYIFINDSLWNINRIELTLHKGALKFYDDFTIRQQYQKVEEDFWIIRRQEFDYTTKAGKNLFTGNTVLVYSDFEKDYVFPEKFFGNEVSVITEEAYKRDTAYWNQARPEALTEDQQKVIHYRDSIELAHKSKAYIDSIETKYNKITVGEVLYAGVGFRNMAKQRDINISPLVGLLEFAVIGGFRLGPYVSWFRRYDSGRMLWLRNGINVGIKNGDVQGSSSIWTRYNPFRQGEAAVRWGRSFYSVNSFDAYLNQLKISNYIVHDFIDVFHRIELFNGFYVTADAGFAMRKSVEGYDRTSILNPIIDETDPLKFDDYEAFITNLRLAYTPKQKYMREPGRKVVLGSKYPTFLVNHRKGWHNVLGSDVDFDYIDLGLEQNILLGTLGNSKYTFVAGRFLNTRDLRYVDYKRFRQSDPLLYSEPMHSFQLLDTSLSARNWFLEAHYIHHFNGALINNIPLVKKLGIRTVAGAGFMWIKENGFRHEEIFAGLERTFKLGARRRLRIGVYGILGQSNNLPPQTDFKLAFDVIDTWKRDWSY